MTHRLKRLLRSLLLGLLTCGFCLLSHPAIAQLPSLVPSTQFQQGQQAYIEGRYTLAADAWQRAAEDYGEAGNSLSQAATLSNLGLAYLKLGRQTAAEVAIATALELAQTFPESAAQQQVLAQVLSAHAQRQLTQGDNTAAIQSFAQALDAYTIVNDTAGILRARLNQAQIFRLQGRHRQALIQLNQVAEQLQVLPDSALKANGLRQLGDALRLVENADEALTVLEASLAVTRTIDAPQEQSATLISLGNTAEALQQPETALAYYAEAAARAPQATLRIQAQINRLRILQAEGALSEARAQLAEILPQLDTLPLGRSSLFVRINLADLLIISDALVSDRAIADLLATTLQQAETLQDSRSQAYALGYLGKLYQRRERWAEATDLTREALTLAQSLNDDSIIYRWQWQLGQLLAVQGNTEEAIATYQQTLQTLQTLRSDLASVNPEVRFSFREGVEPIYRELVSLLLQSEEAQTVPQENLLQARDVVESLQVAELVNFFRADCVVTTPVEIDQVDASALVVYPIILPDRLEILVSAPGQALQRTTVPVDANALSATLDELQRTISFPQPASGLALNRARSARAELSLQAVTGDPLAHLPLAQQAYDWLIRPIELQIQAADPEVLVFVLDGALRNVPMGVLHDGEQYLIESREIALTPGLQLLEPRPLAERELQVLVGGLSEARDDFGALPNVTTEVEAIRAQASGKLLLNEDFSKENFSTQLTGSAFPVVHLATHGKFSSDPEQTFILAWDDRIRATELGTLLQRGELSREAAIEILVLSACETAAGDERAALGLAGIAVRSGARSTLATLWLVDDLGTSVLMEKLYQQLADTQLTKAEALRQAQLQLLQSGEYQHPYFWAPFVLVGNWL